MSVGTVFSPINFREHCKLHGHALRRCIPALPAGVRRSPVTEGVTSGSTCPVVPGPLISLLFSLAFRSLAGMSLQFTDSTSKSSDEWLPTFPGEHPTVSQIEGFFKKAIPLVTVRGYDYDVRGDTPPNLLSFQSVHDLTGLTELNAADAGGMAAAMKHNQYVRKLRAENDLKQNQYAVAIGQHRNLFAQAIILSLSGRAPLRLDALKDKHKVPTKEGLFDGTAMWKDLLLLLQSVPDTQDQADHDRAVELARDRRLADGCAVQDYSDKVTVLQRKHIPFMQRPFPNDAALADFFIDLMPACNGAEGRSIKEKLRIGSVLTPVRALAECTKVVKASESSEVRKAAASAVLLGDYRAEHYGDGAAVRNHLAAACAAATSLGDSQLAATLLNALSIGNPSADGKASPLSDAPAPSGAAKRQAAKAAAAAAQQQGADTADARASQKRAAAAAAAAKNVKQNNGKLADGETCAEGTCHFDHAGKPCWRSPWFKGPLDEPYGSNERLIERINKDKTINASKPGMDKNRLVLLKVNEKVAKPRPAKAAAADGDGVDSFSIFKPCKMLAPVRDADASCAHAAHDVQAQLSDGSDSEVEVEVEGWIEGFEPTDDHPPANASFAASLADYARRAGDTTDHAEADPQACLDDESVTSGGFLHSCAQAEEQVESTQSEPCQWADEATESDLDTYCTDGGDPVDERRDTGHKHVAHHGGARAKGEHVDKLPGAPMPPLKVACHAPRPSVSPARQRVCAPGNTRIMQPDKLHEGGGSAPDASATDAHAQDFESTFSFTQTNVAPWNAFLLGCMTALLIAATFAVLVSCTGVPAATLAYSAGMAGPSSMITAHVPAYCPSSPHFRNLPWNHPIHFFVTLALLAFYAVSLHDAGLSYALYIALRFAIRGTKRVAHIVGAMSAGLLLWGLIAYYCPRGVDGVHVHLASQDAVTLQGALAMGVHVGLVDQTQRYDAMQTIQQRANVTFANLNIIDRTTALSLADSLGIAPTTVPVCPAAEGSGDYVQAGSRPDLTLFDSGSAVHALNSSKYAIPGTFTQNTMGISTANGIVVPPLKCKARLPVRAKSGKRLWIHLTDCLILGDSEYNLVSVGRLAQEMQVTTTCGPLGSHLTFPDATVVPLVNTGDVLLLPSGDVLHDETAACFPSTVAVVHGAEGSQSVGWDVLHARFCHRSHATLKHLPEVVHNAPAAWGRTLKPTPRTHCDECLRAKAPELHSCSHIPSVTRPGQLVSFDVWTATVQHVHGGQTEVIGFHDHYSGVTKYYLLDSQKGEDIRLAISKYLAWARSYNIRVDRLHTDNHPSNAGNTTRKWLAERSVRLTTCAPNVPRQNGDIEKRWNVSRGDICTAVASGIPARYWWFIMAAQMQVAWCIPRQHPNPDVTNMTTPWELWCGRKPDARQFRAMGCLAYYKDIRVRCKLEMRARRALHLGRAEDQPAYVLLDLETRKVIVTPHVRFCETIYPGMTKYAQPNEPDGDILFKGEPRTRPQSPDDDDDSGPSAPPPPAAEDNATNVDDDDDDDNGGGGGGDDPVSVQIKSG